MFKRMIASILTLVLVASGVAAAPVASRAAVKTPSKITTKGYETADGSSKGIKFSWTKVSGVDGYQYTYDLFWGTKKSKEKKALASKNAVKISFKNHETVRFKVRAYKIVKKNGKNKKEFGGWMATTLTAGQVEKLFDNNGSTNTDNGGSTNTDNTGVTGLGGSWADSAKNATLDAREIGGGVYQIDIIWKGTAITGIRWAFYGMFIGTSNNMELSNGTKEALTFNASGDIVSAEPKESGLTGAMTYDADKKTLKWDGSVQYTGLDSDFVFKK